MLGFLIRTSEHFGHSGAFGDCGLLLFLEEQPKQKHKKTKI
jgi:hypothetical protein